MVTISTTPIPQKKSSVISTDLVGGGGYTTYRAGDIVRRTYVGGGGRTAEDVRNIASQIEARRELERKAEEQRQKTLQETQLRQQEASEISKAQQNYRINLRNLSSLQARQNALNKLRQQVSDIKGRFSSTIKTLWSSGLVGVNVPGVTGYPTSSDVRKGITSGTQAIREYEQKKAERYASGNLTAPQRFVEKYDIGKTLGLTKEPTSTTDKKGWSLSQKYFEAFGVQFYKPGEREELLEKGLQNLTEAKTYEEQQEAIKQLKGRGIEVKEQNGTYSVDTKKALQTLAPTSKVGNILTGSADLFFKTAIFSPLMSTTATAKKTAKTEQKVVYRRRFEAEDLVRKAEDLFKKDNLDKFLKDTSKKLTTTEARRNFADYLDELARRGLIKGYSYNENTGVLNLGVSQNVLGTSSIVFTTKTPKIPETAIIGTTPSIYSGTGLYERYSPSENIFIKSIVKPKPSEKLGENIFVGTSPSGRTSEVLGSGKFSGLGQLGRTSTSLGTSLMTNQILGQPTKQISRTQSILRQPTKQQPRLNEVLALTSLFLQKPSYKQITRQAYVQPSKLKEPTKPRQPLKPRIPKLFWDFGKTSSDKKEISVLGKALYDVYIKKRGRNIKIADDLSFMEAKRVLKKKLQRTLRASGYLQEDLTKKKVYADLGEGFRRSKVQPFRVVQKREKRLSSFPERKEIQLFRKKSKRRNFKWI